MRQCSSSWTMFLMFLLQCFSWPQLLQIGPQQPTRSSRLAWNVWTSDLNSFCEFLQIMSSPELAPEWERWKLPVNPNVSQEEDCWRHQELNTKNRDAVVQPRQDIGKYFQTFLDKKDDLFQFFLELLNQLSNGWECFFSGICNIYQGKETIAIALKKPQKEED